MSHHDRRDDRPVTLPPDDQRAAERNVMRDGESRPRSDGITIKTTGKAARNVVLALAGLLAGGGAGYVGHHAADGQADTKVTTTEQRVAGTEQRLNTIERQLSEHLEQVRIDKATRADQDAKRDGAFTNLDKQVSVHLGNLDTSLTFIQADISAINKKLDSGGGLRRQPRNRPMTDKPRAP